MMTRLGWDVLLEGAGDRTTPMRTPKIDFKSLLAEFGPAKDWDSTAEIALRPADQEEPKWLFVAPSKDPAVLARYETFLAQQAEMAPSWTTEDYLGEEVTRSWTACDIAEFIAAIYHFELDMNDDVGSVIRLVRHHLAHFQAAVNAGWLDGAWLEQYPWVPPVHVTPRRRRGRRQRLRAGHLSPVVPARPVLAPMPAGPGRRELIAARREGGQGRDVPGVKGVRVFP
jgi:hypothetical protein